MYNILYHVTNVFYQTQKERPSNIVIKSFDEIIKEKRQRQQSKDLLPLPDNAGQPRIPATMVTKRRSIIRRKDTPDITNRLGKHFNYLTVLKMPLYVRDLTNVKRFPCLHSLIYTREEFGRSQELLCKTEPQSRFYTELETSHKLSRVFISGYVNAENVLY